MSHKSKNQANFEPITCEKLLNRLIRQDKSIAPNASVAGGKKTAPQFQEKLSTLPNFANKQQPPPQRPKPRPTSQPAPPLNSRTKSPAIKTTTTAMTRGPSVSPVRKEVVCEKINMEPLNSKNRRHRSASSSASASIASDRETWGQMLLQHKSRERVSTFSNFDPLRTLHFLSKELHFKIQTAIPDDHDVQQMVADIQHALKRIPPEVASLIHLQQHSEFSLLSNRSALTEVASETVKPTVASKICQTPPTLYQEDTDRFQKLMEENTAKLEMSIKQLEVMCQNLQTEKDNCDTELEQAKQHISVLCGRIKEMENERETFSNGKLQRLEQEKERLLKELDRMQQEARENPTLNHMKKLVEELRIEKSNADQKCAHLEYDMTILSMEKEKLSTILGIRDREIQDIQDEMTRIQEQVSKELKRLNGEVLSRVSSLKTVAAGSRDNFQANKENHEKVGGDATISSINSSDVTRDNTVNIFKDPCGGDGESVSSNLAAENNFVKGDCVESVAATVPPCPPPAQHPQGSAAEQEDVFEAILKDMTPSCKALFSKQMK